MPKFAKRSKENLASCEQPLQDLFNEVVKHFDCTILEGHRNREKQTIAYRSGRSKAQWPDSRHNKYPSQAADVMPYPINWDERERLYKFAGFVEATAIQMGIEVEWGGEVFGKFFDGPHWQLKKPRVRL